MESADATCNFDRDFCGIKRRNVCEGCLRREDSGIVRTGGFYQITNLLDLYARSADNG